MTINPDRKNPFRPHCLFKKKGVHGETNGTCSGKFETFQFRSKKTLHPKIHGNVFGDFPGACFLVKPLANRRVFSLTPGAFRASEHDLPAPSLPGLGVSPAFRARTTWVER